MNRRGTSWVAGVIVLVPVFAAFAQPQMGTAFTYQGRLEDGGALVTDSCDFEFSLWDFEVAGSQQGITLPEFNVTVTDGLFAVALDFGDQFDGDARWLEMKVCCPSGSCTLQTLTPRQELTPAPYGLHAADAGMVEGNSLSDLDNRYVEEGEANSISSGMMQPNSISSGTLQANSVTTSAIQSDAVTTGELGDDAVTVDKLAHNIDATTIGFDAARLEGNDLLDLDNRYVEENEPNSISSGMMQPNSISSSALQSNSVTTSAIQLDAVTTSELADDAVTVDKLAHGIDATGIGFDADKVDGQEASAFAASSHTHYQLHESDGGSVAVYADADGDVGVGITTPLNKLDVSGAVMIGSGYVGTYTAPSNGLVVQGNVGFGPPTPLNKLDVSGAALIGWGWAGNYTAPADGLIVKGDVVIGAISPAPYAKLHVEGGSIAQWNEGLVGGYGQTSVVSKHGELDASGDFIMSLYKSNWKPFFTDNYVFKVEVFVSLDYDSTFPHDYKGSAYSMAIIGKQRGTGLVHFNQLHTVSNDAVVTFSYSNPTSDYLRVTVNTNRPSGTAYKVMVKTSH